MQRSCGSPVVVLPAIERSSSGQRLPMPPFPAPSHEVVVSSAGQSLNMREHIPCCFQPSSAPICYGSVQYRRSDHCRVYQLHYSRAQSPSRTAGSPRSPHHALSRVFCRCGPQFSFASRITRRCFTLSTGLIAVPRNDGSILPSSLLVKRTNSVFPGLTFNPTSLHHHVTRVSVF